MTQYTPIKSPEGEKNASGIAELYTRLRTMILNGMYPPGTLLPQRQLAQALGVSRTPLREVLRILQTEGLIEAGRYQRCQVAPFEPEVLDALYACRIQLETLGVALTIHHLQAHDLDALSKAVAEMHTIHDPDAWEEPHHRFHRLLVSYAGKSLCETINSYAERSERYVRLYGRIDPEARFASLLNHEQIVQAYKEHNEERAVQLLARHLTRTALTILALMAPEYEPVAIRTALHLVRTDSSKETISPRREYKTKREKTADVHS